MTQIAKVTTCRYALLPQGLQLIAGYFIQRLANQKPFWLI